MEIITAINSNNGANTNPKSGILLKRDLPILIQSEELL